jgi:hypothetical protein
LTTALTCFLSPGKREMDEDACEMAAVLVCIECRQWEIVAVR